MLKSRDRGLIAVPPKMFKEANDWLLQRLAQEFLREIKRLSKMSKTYLKQIAGVETSKSLKKTIRPDFENFRYQEVFKDLQGVKKYNLELSIQRCWRGLDSEADYGSRKIRIFYPRGYFFTSRKKLEAYFREVSETLHHEMMHYVQDLFAKSKKTSFKKTTQQTFVEYVLDPEEFQPLIRDAVKDYHFFLEDEGLERGNASLSKYFSLPQNWYRDKIFQTYKSKNTRLYHRALKKFYLNA